MKIIWKTFLLLVALSGGLFDCSIAYAEGSKCKNAVNELNCVVRYRSTIYQQDPDYFWKVLNKARDEALACQSPEKTAEFLKLVGIRNKSAELEEFISEGIEELCADKPACFKQARLLLSKRLRSQLSETLSTPLQREDRELAACR